MEQPSPEPTHAQLVYGLKAIRIATALSILAIVVMVVVFVGLLDVPAVPVVPIAVLVVLTDIGFLAFFTSRRQEAIRRAERREAESSGDGAPTQR